MKTTKIAVKILGSIVVTGVMATYAFANVDEITFQQLDASQSIIQHFDKKNDLKNLFNNTLLKNKLSKESPTYEQDLTNFIKDNQDWLNSAIDVDEKNLKRYEKMAKNQVENYLHYNKGKNSSMFLALGSSFITNDQAVNILVNNLKELKANALDFAEIFEKELDEEKINLSRNIEKLNPLLKEYTSLTNLSKISEELAELDYLDLTKSNFDGAVKELSKLAVKTEIIKKYHNIDMSKYEESQAVRNIAHVENQIESIKNKFEKQQQQFGYHGKLNDYETEMNIIENINFEMRNKIALINNFQNEYAFKIDQHYPNNF